MRKSETVQVPAWGTRDDGRTFLITEMSAAAAEKWAYRLFIALKGTAGMVPLDVERLGMVGVAIRGLNAFLAADVKFEDLEPLLDEMFECVTMIRDMKHPGVATKLMPDDIEEIRTRGWLRSEVLRVHTGFSLADAMSNLLTMIQASADSSTTQTSPPSLGA